MYIMCSFSVPYGDQGQNKKGEKKVIHVEILKTGVLPQGSLSMGNKVYGKLVSAGTKERTKECSTRMHF